MSASESSAKPLKIGLNARLLADGSMRGWNRYAVNLVAALARSGEAEILLLTDAPVAAEHRAVFEQHDIRHRIREITSGPMPYPKWQEWWLPRVARSQRLDLLHTPFHFGLPWFAPCPTVATLHDAIDVLHKRPWGQRIQLKSLLSRFYLWEARHRATGIITVSRFSATDLAGKLHIPKSKIAVIAEAADPLFHQPMETNGQRKVLRSYAVGSAPYVFYVGGLEERKNMPLAVQALAKIKNLTFMELVLAGGSRADIENLKELVKSLGLADRVRFLGRVPDADLPALYSGALALVYPSRWEGFGLQLVEAMATGCPVLASSAASLPEVLGNGGELFSPDDPDELAALFMKLQTDEAWRQTMAEKSRKRGSEFSWEQTAQETLRLYRSLIRSNNKPS